MQHTAAAAAHNSTKLQQHAAANTITNTAANTKLHTLPTLLTLSNQTLHTLPTLPKQTQNYTHHHKQYHNHN